MKILFMGTPDFAVPSLRALYGSGEEIVGVVTQPDKPRGRGYVLTPPPVKTYAAAHGLPVFQPARLRDGSFDDTLKALEPELIVVVAYGKILPPHILEAPKHGCINVHGSLLPALRGAAPMQRAILNGLDVTGVTTMYMAEGMDTGDMLLQRAVDILPTETCGELTERLSHVGAELLLETIHQLEAGTLKRIPQDESQMTYDPKLTKEMGVVDWTRNAQAIVGQIHGLNPWPGASTAWEGGRLKLLRAEATQGSGTPGEILLADAKNGLVVACGSGAVRVLNLQAPGGKPMSSKDYLRGHPMAAGSVLKEEEA